MSVWFICTGAINRSPAAATIWNAWKDLPRARAAAVSPHNRGRSATGKIRRALEEAGFVLPPEYRSVWVGDAGIAPSDEIWVMQPSHLLAVRQLVRGSRPRLLSAGLGLKKVPDPHFDSSPDAHAKAVELLHRLIKKLIEEKE